MCCTWVMYGDRRRPDTDLRLESLRTARRSSASPPTERLLCFSALPGVASFGEPGGKTLN